MMWSSMVFCLLLGMSVAQLDVHDPMQESVYFYPRPSYMAPHMYVKPSDLITRDTMPPHGHKIHFITDYPYPYPGMLGQNHYIKPGDLVATTNVNSGPLYFRKRENPEGLNISKKKNILYLAIPVLSNNAPIESEVEVKK